MRKPFCIAAVLLWLLSPGAFAQTAGNEITFLSYNILEGLKNDSLLKKQFTEWVAPINPDIVAFQETNKFTQKSLEEFAARYHHPYAVLAKEPGFPVAITSKYPIVNVQKVLDNMWHGYIYANILDYHLFILHLSPFSYKKRQHEIRQIIAHARLLPENAKIIFAGDFNAMSAVDKDRYGPELTAQMKANEEKHAHIRNLNEGAPDYSVIGQMTEAGYIDVFHKLNGVFKNSIPTGKYATAASIPRRIDFIFVSPALSGALRKADIIHDKDTDVLSDHYPVVMKLRR